MTYVERRLQLRNGPPWGFRLYEDFMEGLIVSKIRKRSPAEMAGMQEGDHVLEINGLDALDMSHARAVQIIDSTSYVLEIIVGRYERLQRMETIYLNNDILRSKQIPQEITTTELQLFWEKDIPLRPVRKIWPPPKPNIDFSTRKPVVRMVSPPPKPTVIHLSPPPQQPPQPQPPRSRDFTDMERKIIPNDPDISSVSVKQLLREFDVPPVARGLKKKTYADSTFYSDPSRYYPTIEEQIEMARRVADSLHAPENSLSRGVNMFEKQRIRADKHVREGPEPEPDPIEMASPEELENMTPPSPPPPPPPPAPSFPGLQPVNKPPNNIPPPPPLPPGQPKTVQEFLEKIKVFPTTKHSDLDPQKCFDIATALYTSDSKGAKMFAKRHARAKKWDNEATEDSDKMDGTVQSLGTGNSDQIRSRLIPKLAKNPVNSDSHTAIKPSQTTEREKEQSPRTKISLVDEGLTAPMAATPIDEAMPKPFGIGLSFSGTPIFAGQMENNSSIEASNLDNDGSKSGWRPVKFKLAQAAS